MIIFHKYEIRLMPGKTALELYAPNWGKGRTKQELSGPALRPSSAPPAGGGFPTQVSQSGTDSGRHPSRSRAVY